MIANSTFFASVILNQDNSDRETGQVLDISVLPRQDCRLSSEEFPQETKSPTEVALEARLSPEDQAAV